MRHPFKLDWRMALTVSVLFAIGLLMDAGFDAYRGWVASH